MNASIIIPVRNRYELTANCLRSLQITAPGAEVIVVDNGSTDQTVDLEREFPSVAVLRFKENQGFAPACNAGAQLAGGDAIIFLNNDTVTLPGWLEPLLENLSDETVGAVGSLLLYPDGSVQHAGMAATKRLQWVHVHRGADPTTVPGVYRAKDLQSVTGACFGIRFCTFRDFGGFDEQYTNGYEDVDLCFRLRKSGLRIRYEPRSVLIHLEAQTEGRMTNEPGNIVRFYGKWRKDVRPDHDRIVHEDSIPDP